jgi:hypothetical protein
MPPFTSRARPGPQAHGKAADERVANLPPGEDDGESPDYLDEVRLKHGAR